MNKRPAERKSKTDYIIIILHKDYTMEIYPDITFFHKDNFESENRFFKMSKSATAFDICEWYVNEYKSSKIVEF